jgi:rhamnopyranosyl-N-acetylglucosaminyl-diphospho-decaprenol beta-1,3/1,4-galactofuranosyltransferase
MLGPATALREKASLLPVDDGNSIPDASHGDYCEKKKIWISEQPTMRIWAVLVAYQRDTEVERLLNALAKQSTKLSGVIIIDNADQASTACLSERHGAHYIGSKRNLGGAGGFALGMMTALAHGAEHIWLWDDDGFPEDERCLGLLLDAALEHSADLISPLVVNDANHEETAFAFRLSGKRTNSRQEVQQNALIKDFVHLFNGALLRADALERFGLPDYRFFIRGDEVDFMYRLVRAGGKVFTYPAAVACHPSGAGDVHKVPGLPFGVVVPTCPLRREITFRNRAQNFLRHRKFILQIADYPRYGLYFLVRTKPDFSGFWHWLRATWQGYRGITGRQQPHESSKRVL